MEASFTVQKFRSPVDGEIVSIKVNSVDNSVLWRHILRTFGNATKVRVDDMEIQFMTDDQYEDLLPLRIEAIPNSIMDVILSKNSTEEMNQMEGLPPKYNEVGRNTEDILTEVLPFTCHTNQPGDEYVRFGSRISLQHVSTGSYLHSVNWKYRIFPRLCAVQGVRSSEPCLEDFWQVVPACGNTNPEEINQKSGGSIRYSTRVRLVNVANKRWLHSHGIKSPISDQKDVSTYGSISSSNNDDVWIVERFENRIYMGENEVTTCETYNNLSNFWRAGFA
ncbi:hypothetical protein BGZ76_009924 [Entomortierella beljakovae]|nr:hypothetical protein BGZ76_009924 [Entomortierella beljakovae]